MKNDLKTKLYNLFNIRNILVFTFCILLLISTRFVPPSEVKIVVELEATVSDGRYIQIFFNDVPSSQLIKRGERTVYTFVAEVEQFDGVRFDPTDSIDAKFSLHRLTLKTISEEILLNTSDFTNWRVSGADFYSDPKYNYVTTSSDSIFKSTPKLVQFKQKKETFLQNLSKRISKSASDGVIFFGILSLLYLFFGYSGTFLLTLGVLLIYFSISSSLYQFLLTLDLPVPTAAESVGWVNFNGYKKSADVLLCLILVVLSSVIGIWIKRLRNIQNNHAVGTYEYIQKITYWEIFLIFLIYLISQAPNFKLGFVKITESFYSLGWDEMNVFTWKYFYENGKSPLVDFWYPYGNQNLASGPYWQDLLITFSHRIFYFILFLFSLVEIFDKKRFPIWFAITVYALICLFNFNLAPDRYFFSFSVLLFAISLFYKEKYLYFKLLVMTLACIWLILWEPHQYVYFLFGLGCFIFCKLVGQIQQEKRISRTFFTLYFKVFAMTLVSLVLSLLLYYSQGKWTGLISLFSQTGGYSNNAATAVDFTNILKSPYSIAGNTFHLFFFAFAVIFYGINILSRPITIWTCFLLGSTGFIFPLILKNLMRPHMAHQIIGIQLISLVIYFLSFSAFRERVFKSILPLAFLGLLIGHFFIEPNLSNFVSSMSSIENSLRSPFEVDEKYFSSEKSNLVASQYSLNKISISGITLSDLSKFVDKNYKNKNIYVLGDISVSYIAFNTPIPYTISFYDGSHIELQKQLMHWIEDNEIQVIMWDWKVKSFDEVPFLVKNPNLFIYMIRNFEFDKNVGEFHFLRRKSELTPINLEYWIDHLGDSIDFGYLGMISSRKYMADCLPITKPNDCHEYLEIQPTSDKTKQIELQGQIGSKIVSLKLMTESKKVLLLPTSAIWFWNWLEPQAGNLLKGSNYKIVYFKKKRDFLY